MRKNRKWLVCKAVSLDFPTKQDVVLKIKERCHLEHKKPEQMPLKILELSQYTTITL